ncbi:MAG: DinB family protein [Ignavibacteriaceae bacterium]
MKNSFLQKKINDVNNVVEESKQLFAYLSDEQFITKPNLKKWSVCECFNHLFITGSLYLPKIKNAIEYLKSNNIFEGSSYKPSFTGRFFYYSLRPESKIKLKTFKIFKPENNFSDLSIKEKFLNQQKEFIELIKSADGYDLNRIKFSSPVSNLFKFSLGDAILIVTVHLQRHLLQARKLTNNKDHILKENYRFS